MFDNLNKEAKTELKIVFGILLIAILCWVGVRLYKNMIKEQLEYCMDECKRAEVIRMLNDKMPEDEIRALIPALDDFCIKKCN